MPLVDTEDRGAVRHIVMTRAEKRNAMNGELVVALGEAFKDAANDESVRVVVVRGDGPMFSSGMDLGNLHDLAGQAHMLRPFRNECIEAWNRLEEMTKPTIVQIHGACIGGAMELALAADMRVMAEDSVAGLLETRIGLIPDVGGCSRLPAVVGVGIAKELIMTGKVVRRPRGAPDRLRQPDRARRRARRDDRGALQRAAGVRADRRRPGQAGDRLRRQARARADARAGGHGADRLRRVRRLRRGRAGVPRQARPRVCRAVAPRREATRARRALLAPRRAAVRFIGIGSQSFWLDEVVTAELVGMPFGDMLSTIPDSESTPYLYYVLLWPGRSCSATARPRCARCRPSSGSATVAAVWAGARDARLGARGAGGGPARRAQPVPRLVLAGGARLRAARAALRGVVLAVRARARATGDGRALAWWARRVGARAGDPLLRGVHDRARGDRARACSPAARARGRSPAAAIGLAALALVPLAAQQRRGGGADWIGDISPRPPDRGDPEALRGGRVRQPARLRVLAGAACALVALALLLCARHRRTSAAAG